MIKIIVGVELEFYSTKPKEFFGDFVKNEIGEGQLEAVFAHSSNYVQVLKNVVDFKKKFNSVANFNAYHPLLPSSSLQFNISILKDNELFLTHNILHHLLIGIKPNLHFFAPTENCIQRLTDIEKIKEFRNSPYTLCVGEKNNRTAAIRIIDGRIEHRVPSSNCNVIKSFRAILNSITNGASDDANISLPILHSNAFEEEVINSYNLEKII